MAKSILICDDAAFMRMMIKDILVKNGYNIAGEAENGVKAVEKYQETKPDLVLMDITMPEMDGITTMRLLKASGYTIPPVIALTANSYDGIREKYISEGFSDYLSKPINFKDLNKIITKFFSNKMGE